MGVKIILQSLNQFAHKITFLVHIQFKLNRQSSKHWIQLAASPSLFAFSPSLTKTECALGCPLC